MEFYIFQNNEWKRVYIETEPSLIRVFDTTNDSFNCVLKANKREEPIVPMTAFKIVKDTESKIMWIINDSVSVFSSNPKTYKHSLSLVQYRYFLNKHLIRNTIFNQPKNKTVKLYCAASCVKDYDADNQKYELRTSTDGSLIMHWTDAVSFGTKGKIKAASYEVKLFCSTFVEGSSTTVTTYPVPVITENENFRIKDGAKFVIYDTGPSGIAGEPLFALRMSPHDTRIEWPQEEIESLNAYLIYHPDAILAATIEVEGAAEGTLYDKAFAYLYGDGYVGNVTIQLHMDFEIYNYTMYDIVNILLQQYKLETSNVTKRDALFVMPQNNSDLYKLLKSTYPPDNFAFNQCTFYDALMEVFRFYDAGFKFNENKELEIEYYNNYEKDVTSDIKITGSSMTHSDKDYNNSKVAYYQNAIVEVKYDKIPTRSIELGITRQQDDFNIILPYPIYSITKLEYNGRFTGKLPINASQTNAPSYNFSASIDITPFIFEDEVWSTLNEEVTQTNRLDIKSQNYSLHYRRGEKNINVSNYWKSWNNIQRTTLKGVISAGVARFFGYPRYGTGDWQDPTSNPSPTDFYKQNFNIEYLAINDGRLITESLEQKYNGEELNNQSNSFVDLSKLGVNMFGESLKNGIPTLSVVCTLTKWDSKIKEGDYIIRNGEKWVANVVNYNIINEDTVRCSVEFSKNFNALSMRVTTDKAKRLTNIDIDSALLSEDNYIDYIYVYDFNYGPIDRDDNLGIGRDSIMAMVGQTFGLSESAYTYHAVDCGLVSSYLYENGEALCSNIYIPITKYGSGNCVCFEMQFNHPLSAGNMLKYEDETYLSTICYYTDKNGWADYITIDFVQETPTYKDPEKTVDFGTLPQMRKTYGSQVYFETVGKIENLHYFKKQNEIFALNYEWCFLPVNKDNFFIGSAFINDNYFVNPEKAKLKKFYLYYTMAADKHKYSIMDVQGVMGAGLTRQELTFATQKGSYYFVLWCMTAQQMIATGSWAVCDEEGRIYFASNSYGNFWNTPEKTATGIYFMTKSRREVENYGSLPTPYPLSGSEQVKIAPSEWTFLPATWEISFNTVPSPTDIIFDTDGGASWTFTSARQPAGNTSVPKTIKYANLVTNGDQQSLSYSYQTDGIQRYVVFSANIHIPDYSGQAFKGTITYAFTDQYQNANANFRKQVPELIGATLSSLTISPSSVVLDGNTWNNRVEFDSATGTFTGFVKQATVPSGEVTYTIEYTVA